MGEKSLRIRHVKHLLLLVFIGLAFLACGDSDGYSEVSATQAAMDHIDHLSNSIGIRVAGSQEEAEAGDYINSQFEMIGLDTTIQDFEFEDDDGTHTSRNIVAILSGESSKEIIVGAHYDSVDIGEGASDNASGVGLMLAMAKRLKDRAVPYTIRFIAFGAEEIGLVGSDYYASQMTADEIANTVGMINLDTVVGGDMIYAYSGAGEAGWLRNDILEIATLLEVDLQTNPGLNEDYPAGTTGDWSDHAPFKNLGIDYLYLEATNWEIGDLDGYVQTVDHGEIWHTENDTLAFFDAEYPGRIEAQLEDFTLVLEELLLVLSPPEAVPGFGLVGKVQRRPVRYLHRDGSPY